MAGFAGAGGGLCGAAGSGSGDDAGRGGRGAVADRQCRRPARRTDAARGGGLAGRDPFRAAPGRGGGGAPKPSRRRRCPERRWTCWSRRWNGGCPACRGWRRWCWLRFAGTAAARGMCWRWPACPSPCARRSPGRWPRRWNSRDWIMAPSTSSSPAPRHWHGSSRSVGRSRPRRVSRLKPRGGADTRDRTGTPEGNGFSHHFGFRRRPHPRAFVVRTIPSAWPPAGGFSRGPSSLYTFPEGRGLARDRHRHHP
jgi:hypothetical protein